MAIHVSGGGGGGYPGVTADGLTPHGLIVQGSVVALDGVGNNASFGPDSSNPLVFYDKDGNEVLQLFVGASGSGGAALSIGTTSSVGPSGVDISTSSTSAVGYMLKLWNANGPIVIFQADGNVSFIDGIGVFGHAPVTAQPVLATGAAHTVDSVISLLQSYGLCKQS